MAASRSVLDRHHRRRTGCETALRRLWAWLTDSGYRPERHYMRGGRSLAVGLRP